MRKSHVKVVSHGSVYLNIEIKYVLLLYISEKCHLQEALQAAKIPFGPDIRIDVVKGRIPPKPSKAKSQLRRNWRVSQGKNINVYMLQRRGSRFEHFD